MDVITIGETMVSFTPDLKKPIKYNQKFNKGIAGSESNVAVGLSKLGCKVGWISKLGQDEFGEDILSLIQGEGVDVSNVTFDNKYKTGLLFKENTINNKIKIIYYRENSAASNLIPNDINAEYLKKAKHIYISGITPLLSKSCYETVMHVIDIAKSNQLNIIFDPNIRYNLLKSNSDKLKLLKIASNSNFILSSYTEAEFLFDTEDVKMQAEYFFELNEEIKVVAIKKSSTGTYFFERDANNGFVPNFEVEEIEPIGAGDGFAAGFISGLLQRKSIKECVEKGNAVGAAVVTMIGDIEGLPNEGQLNEILSDVDIIR